MTPVFVLKIGQYGLGIKTALFGLSRVRFKRFMFLRALPYDRITDGATFEMLKWCLQQLYMVRPSLGRLCRVHPYTLGLRVVRASVLIMRLHGPKLGAFMSTPQTAPFRVPSVRSPPPSEVKILVLKWLRCRDVRTALFPDIKNVVS